jgi:hypothetical protein
VRGERLEHLAEDVEAAVAGLGERLLEDLRERALDLDVHLDGGDALGGAADLEVHVAEVVLVAEDVGEDGVACSPSLMRPIAMPATGALIGTPASMSESSRRRRWPSTLEPFDSSDLATRCGSCTGTVGRRDHARERALGEGAVADLAAAGAAHGLGLTVESRAGSCSGAGSASTSRP